jgi:hypothetical protein
MYRYLKGNKSTATPQTLCFVDTETLGRKTGEKFDRELHTLRLGCATIGRIEGNMLTRRKTLDFKIAREFWDWLASNTRKSEPCWIFIHNAGFDLPVLEWMELLTDGTLTFKGKPRFYKNRKGEEVLSDAPKGFICIDSPPTILNFYDKTGKQYYVVDTLNYWVTSLAKIGEMVGTPKKKMPSFNDTDEEWFKYCRRDVDVLEQAVLGLVYWVKSNDLGKFRFTAPSMAMAAFRHRFNEARIVLHDVSEVKKLERRGYYGGRLECFFIGHIHAQDSSEVFYYPGDYEGNSILPVGPIYELDVASLYPSVMKDFLFPRNLVEYSQTGVESDLPTDCNTDELICDVLLQTDKPDYPLRHSLGTIYPVGKFITTLCGPEFTRALTSGHVVKVYQWARYELATVFTGFVDFFWSYRRQCELEGKKIEADLAKLLMNSLYGKFGQQISEWSNVAEDDSLDPWEQGCDIDIKGNKINQWRTIGKMLQVRGEPQEHPSSFPGIAAYVTSYGRQRLYEFMEIAGRCNVLYISTDAIYVTQTGYNNLFRKRCIADRTIGKLSVKHDAPAATFTTLHNYQLGDRICKGSVKKSAVEISSRSYSELHFESFHKSLTSKPKAGVYVENHIKTIPNSYKRGKKTKSGWVAPLKFGQLEDGSFGVIGTGDIPPERRASTSVDNVSTVSTE